MYGRKKRKIRQPAISSKGFTIVELVISIMIMGIIFSLGFANYRDFQRRQQLESAVRLVKGDLHYAQQLAIAGRKPADPAGNPCETTTLVGYVFDRTSNSTYQILARCEGGDVMVKGPVSLPVNIQIGGFGGGNEVLFRVLARGVARTGTTTISFTFPDSGVVARQITISTSGEIN
jgi:prepilin-type N-terminal cleavage/methylation domain-containing protein